HRDRAARRQRRRRNRVPRAAHHLPHGRPHRDGASLSNLPGFTASSPWLGLSSFGAAPVVSSCLMLATGGCVGCNGGPTLSAGTACCAAGAGSGATVCATA